MANAVCMGAMLKCSFGVAPSSLVVLPLNRVMSPQPVANIMDSKPFMNIMPFGMCQSLANPIVGAPTVLLGNMPILNNSAKLMCMWAGVIEILPPGVPTVMTP